MSNLKIYTAVLLIVMLGVPKLQAGHDKAGTTGFNFLRVTYSPRAAGMANAYTAQSDDLEALFFNPAGLPQLKSRAVSTSYINYFEGFQGGSVAFAAPFGEHLTTGILIQYLGNNSIPRTLVNEQNEYLGTAGSFGANDFIVGLAGGYDVHEFLNLGASLRYIHQTIDDYSASALVVDLAVMHQTMNENLRVGATLRNLGKQVSYYTSAKYNEKLPTQLSVGFNYSLHESITANIDIIKPFDQEFSGRVGLEYRAHPMLALRTGFNSRADDWRMGGDYDFLSGLSAGFGCFFRQYELNYAISSYGDLGMVNQVSLKYFF